MGSTLQRGTNYIMRVLRGLNNIRDGSSPLLLSWVELGGGWYATSILLSPTSVEIYHVALWWL